LLPPSSEQKVTDYNSSTTLVSKDITTHPIACSSSSSSSSNNNSFDNIEDTCGSPCKYQPSLYIKENQEASAIQSICNLPMYVYISTPTFDHIDLEANVVDDCVINTKQCVLKIEGPLKKIVGKVMLDLNNENSVILIDGGYFKVIIANSAFLVYGFSKVYYKNNVYDTSKVAQLLYI
jgi:hypothetical protein